MASTTKRALESSLKKLLLEKPLNKITVTDICEDCGISRMTFYYHFQDIYDLVEWSCQEDAGKALAGNRTVDTWQKGLLSIFNLVRENRPFVMNVYRCVSRERVERYLYDITYGLLRAVVDEKAEGLQVCEEDKRFVAGFFRYAFVGVMLDWVTGDMKDDPETLVHKIDTIIHGDFRSALERFAL